jgi:hypothetical protein
MTKKLETLFNLPGQEEFIDPKTFSNLPSTIDLQEKLEEFDKISSALGKGLGRYGR